MKCLFCEDSLQTWYIYESLDKMRCQNCEGIRPLERPLAAEECPQCRVYTTDGLLTYADISGCE
jgi:hypothetical protein